MATLLDRAVDAFGGAAARSEPVGDLKALHAKIGELTLENDSFRRRAHQGWTAERKKKIDRKTWAGSCCPHGRA